MQLKEKPHNGRLQMACRWAAVAACGVLALCALPAQAEIGPYIGLEVGQSLNPHSPVRLSAGGGTVAGELGYDSGLVGGMTFGYALPGHLRPELEVNYRRNGMSGLEGAVSAIDVMGNVWFDFESRGGYFYFGGGIGDLHLHATTGAFGDTTNTFGGQLGVGLGVFFTPQLSLGVDYRYTSGFSHSSFRDNGSRIRTLYRSQAIMLGFRYSFGRIWNPLDAGPPAPVRVVPVQKSQ